MDRAKLEKMKVAKGEAKATLKGKDKIKLTQKEINALVVKIAEMLNII